MAQASAKGSLLYVGIGTSGTAFDASAAAALNTTTNNLSPANAGVVRSIDYPDTIAMHENTSFGDTAVSRQPGLPDVGDITLEMALTSVTWALVVGHASTSWRALTQAATPVPVRVVVAPLGLANGSPYWYVNAYFAGASRSANPADPQGMSVTLSASGPVTYGNWTA
jgi:hypothetical protein